MEDDQASEVLYPSHDWGRMASDPFKTIGREDVEMREMLKHIWTRSGGDIALFDLLIPLDDPCGRRPNE